MADTLTVFIEALKVVSSPAVQGLVKLYLEKHITADELKRRIDALPDAPPPKENGNGSHTP